MAAALPRGRPNGIAVVHREAQRLLPVHMQPALQTRHHVLGVEAERRGHDHGIQVNGSFVLGLERNSSLVQYAIRTRRFGLGYDYARGAWVIEVILNDPPPPPPLEVPELEPSAGENRGICCIDLIQHSAQKLTGHQSQRHSNSEAP